MARKPAEAATPPAREDRGQAPPTAPGPPLPDVSSLGPGSDYRPFLDRRVAPALRRLALRRLWRSDPRFASLDGLNDYDEDFGALHRRGAAVLRAAREAGRRILARAAEPRDPSGHGAEPGPGEETGNRESGSATAEAEGTASGAGGGGGRAA